MLLAPLFGIAIRNGTFCCNTLCSMFITATASGERSQQQIYMKDNIEIFSDAPNESEGTRRTLRKKRDENK